MIEKAAMPLELKNRLKEDITKENLSAAGIKAFEYILSSCTSPQVIVSPEEIQARIENKKSFIQSRLLGEVKEVCSLEPVHSRPNIGHSYTPPRNEFERRIAQIWQEVFGIQQVGIHDDFFELGGDSLLALRVSSRLRDAFQVEFPLQRFFEFPTVASLTSAITQIPNEQEDSEKLDKILKEIETSSEND
jgi:acyl carrier protein